MRIGHNELIIILIIVIIVFGPTQIPKLVKMFGKSAKSFKEGMEEPGETEEDVPAPKKAKKAKAAAKKAEVKAEDDPDEDEEG